MAGEIKFIPSAQHSFVQKIEIGNSHAVMQRPVSKT